MIILQFFVGLAALAAVYAIFMLYLLVAAFLVDTFESWMPRWAAFILGLSAPIVVVVLSILMGRWMLP